MLDPALDDPAESPTPARDRLLDVAERLFALHGYAGTSVRDITRSAGCNLASVNYYFDGKLGLYREVFLRRMVGLRERRVAAVEGRVRSSGGGVTVESVLRAFAEAFLEPLVNDSGGRLFVILITRERLDPQLPRALFEAELVEPVRKALHDALEEAVPSLAAAALADCIDSFVAQLIAVARQPLHGEEETARPTPLTLQRRIGHIVRFTAAGIRSYAGGHP